LDQTAGVGFFCKYIDWEPDQGGFRVSLLSNEDPDQAPRMYVLLEHPLSQIGTSRFISTHLLQEHPLWFHNEDTKIDGTKKNLILCFEFLPTTIPFDVQQCIDKGLCTFLATGPRFCFWQSMYTCHTCQFEGGNVEKGLVWGFCESCKQKCHAGHEVTLVEKYFQGGFYCDCGDGKIFSHLKCLALGKDNEEQHTPKKHKLSDD